MGIKFKLGDLVWAKVKSHPWWPGQIFNKALAPPLVKEAKFKGFLLISFFGDNTYRWLDPAELIPFEPYYLEKANQSRSSAFLIAVQEAVGELSKRAALGLACRCRNPSKFSHGSWLQNIDINGYGGRVPYPVHQPEKFRDEFKPVEMLSFLQRLALRSIDVCKDGAFLKNVAWLLAYREAVFEEKDDTYDEAFDTYDEAFEVLPSGDSTDTNDRGKALVQVSLSDQSLASEAQGKILGKRVILEKPVDGQKRSRKDKLVKGLILEEEIEEPGAILVMKFLNRATMPSNSELKAMFAHFGPVDISTTYASQNSSTCQVGLKTMSNAQAAYDYAVRNENLFGETNVTYCLQGAEVSSAFNKVQPWSSGSAEAADGPYGGGKSPPLREDDYQEGNTVKSPQTIPPSARSPCILTYHRNLSQKKVAQITDAMIKKCFQNQASKMENTLTATISNSQGITDIAQPLLKLLEECEECIYHMNLKYKFLHGIT